jgi:hypothetical protein
MVITEIPGATRVRTARLISNFASGSDFGAARLGA